MKIDDYIIREMTSEEKIIAKIADSVIDSYSGSYKPHLIKHEDGVEYKTVYIKHLGFIMFKDTNGEVKKVTMVPIPTLSEYIEIVSNRIGLGNVSFDKIKNNSAVKHLLEEKKLEIDKCYNIIPFYYDGQIWFGFWSTYDSCYYFTNQAWKTCTEGNIKLQMDASDPNCDLENLKKEFILRYKMKKGLS